MSTEPPQPKAVPRTEVALPRPQDRWRCWSPRSVCTSLPGAELTWRPAHTHARSQASLCSSLLLSFLGQGPFCLSWVLLPLRSLGGSGGSNVSQASPGMQVAPVPGPWVLVLSPGTHGLCDPGQSTPLSDPQFLRL